MVHGNVYDWGNRDLWNCRRWTGSDGYAYARRPKVSEKGHRDTVTFGTRPDGSVF